MIFTFLDPTIENDIGVGRKFRGRGFSISGGVL
jgi:hypothetical protein